MKVSMYIYARELPGQHMQPICCINCRRLIFKANTDQLVISNAYGAGTHELPPSTNFIELRCRNCNADYAILFQ